MRIGKFEFVAKTEFLSLIGNHDLKIIINILQTD